VRVGDRLLAVDGFDVATSTLAACTQLLRGPPGSGVCLTIEYDVVCFGEPSELVY